MKGTPSHRADFESPKMTLGVDSVQREDQIVLERTRDVVEHLLYSKIHTVLHLLINVNSKLTQPV